MRTSKGGNAFCYPEHIAGQLNALFARLHAGALFHARSAEDFAEAAADFLSDLNAIHAFREGNGRAQLAFMALLSAKAGYVLDLRKIKPGPFLDAMVESFSGQNERLREALLDLLERDDQDR